MELASGGGEGAKIGKKRGVEGLGRRASILERMAAFSGKLITWDAAMASDLELAPGLDDCTWESDAPVMPDADGKNPVAMPGVTKVL